MPWPPTISPTTNYCLPCLSPVVVGHNSSTTRPRLGECFGPCLAPTNPARICCGMQIVGAQATGDGDWPIRWHAWLQLQAGEPRLTEVIPTPCHAFSAPPPIEMAEQARTSPARQPPDETPDEPSIRRRFLPRMPGRSIVWHKRREDNGSSSSEIDRMAGAKPPAFFVSSGPPMLSLRTTKHV